MNFTTIFSKPFTLSDEEVIQQALSAVTAYAKSHSYESVNVTDCVNAALQEIETIWRKNSGHPQWSSYTLKVKDKQEISEITSRIRAELTEKAVRKATSLLKNQKIRKISATSTEAILDEALGKMGLKYHIIHQTYRAKVHIRLPNHNIMQFIILYSEMKAGKMEEILNQIRTILSNLISSGRDIQVTHCRWKWDWE